MGAVAGAFRSKTSSLEYAIRSMWLEVFRSAGHDLEKDFLQMLEVPPLSPISPGFRKIRCRHHTQGSCALEQACTYSHDPRAPPSLEIDSGIVRTSPLVMTQNQYT